MENPPEKPNERGDDRLGRRAFDMEFGRLAAGVVIADDDPRVEEVSRQIARARRAADAGDFVGAIRLLGDLKISVTPAEVPGLDAGIRPEDVEQALGDLRRALARDPSFPGRAQVQALCRAAREAASEGRWEGAWALIDEADQRLGEALAAKGSRDGNPSAAP